MVEFDPDLRDAIRKAVDSINAYYEELNGSSARAAAILAVANLDNELTAIIRRHFSDDLDKDVWERIFGPGSPMGDFVNKTNFIEAIGHFGKQTRIAIGRMGTIRNKFAHDPEIRAFTHPKVLHHCKLLGANPIHPYVLRDDETEEIVRENFMETIAELHKRLDAVRHHVKELDHPLTPLP